LGREGEHGELLDAELGGVAEPLLDDVGAGLVALQHRQALPLCPAAVAVGDDRYVPRGGGQTSRISSSFPFSSASISAIAPSVCFCRSVSARRSSSSPASPSFFSSRRSLITSRRTLRTAPRPSSATPLTTLTISRRRSSVISGIARRIRLPSLDGVRPMSDSWIDFSIAPIALLSNGVTVSSRASLAATLASCLSGVWAP